MEADGLKEEKQCEVLIDLECVPYREVGSGRGAEVGDGLRLLLEDPLDGGGNLADGHNSRGGVLVSHTLDADAGGRDA